MLCLPQELARARATDVQGIPEGLLRWSSQLNPALRYLRDPRRWGRTSSRVRTYDGVVAAEAGEGCEGWEFVGGRVRPAEHFDDLLEHGLVGKLVEGAIGKVWRGLDCLEHGAVGLGAQDEVDVVITDRPPGAKSLSKRGFSEPLEQPRSAQAAPFLCALR